MQGIIIQFRRGRHTLTTNQFLVKVDGVDNREKAEKLKGKEVEWKSAGKVPKIIKGQVAGAHGGKGILRCRFERGLPGQSITTKVEIK